MHKLTQSVCSALNEMGKFISFRKFGMYINSYTVYAISDLQNWNELLVVYESLADEKSKETFTKLVIFRQALELLPVNIAIDEYGLYSNKEWALLEEKANVIEHASDDHLGERIETWILKGYEYGDCRASEGDVVIDAGALTGNTPIYFSQLVGDSGAVYAFEPTPETYKKLCTNIKKFTNIIPINRGLAQENTILRFACVEGMPGANRFCDNGELELPVCSIDSFAEEKDLDRVDFIKMDVEGFEGNILLGAQSVIQKFKPKMAICIYHRPEDIFILQKKILEICDNYKFYIKHNYKLRTETVLFCMPTEEKCALPAIESNDGSIIMQEIFSIFKTQFDILSSNDIDVCSRKKLTTVLLARHKVRLKASWNRRVAKFMRSCQKRRTEIAAKYQAWQESKKK